MEWTNLLFFGIGLSLYFVLHSVLADQQVKIFLIGKGVSKRYYRLAYNFFSIASILPLLWYYTQIESTFLLEMKWLGYFGLTLTIIGALLLFLALRQYDLAEFSGVQQLKVDATPDSGELKNTGFNGLVRHPLYFSGLLMLWGWWGYQPTDLFLVVALVTTAYLYIGTRLEEQKLVMEFGAVYLKYQQEVWMLLPFAKRKK